MFLEILYGHVFIKNLQTSHLRQGKRIKIAMPIHSDVEKNMQSDIYQ
jgi:hypothetical protein